MTDIEIKSLKAQLELHRRKDGLNDLEGYTDHEKGRREWQERTHPAEFKIMTSIREQFKK